MVQKPNGRTKTMIPIGERGRDQIIKVKTQFSPATKELGKLINGQGFLMLIVGFFMYKGLRKLTEPRKGLRKLIEPHKSLAHAKCEIEENNILTNLPVDVLELITKGLFINDYLALRAVCRSCRKTISNVIENKHCYHLPEMPQVFLQFKYSRFFFSLSNKSLHHHLATPPLRYADKCIGSIKGWLIMSDYSERVFVKCFFWNPVTNVRIMIPSKLSLPPTYRYFSVRGGIKKPPLEKMVASSKPNCDGSSDCHLVGLFNDYRHIAIYKLFENSWTIVESDKDSGSYFRDVEIIGTKLYVVVSDSSSNSILVYCLKDSINGPPKAKVLAEFPIISILKSRRSNCMSCYLAKDEALRELYFISMFCNIVTTYETQQVNADGDGIFSGCAEPLQVNNFEMFKLDTNKDPIGWQNVQLEDRVAFVSNFSNIVMSRDELNVNKDLIRGNIIYFAFYYRCPTNPWLSLQLGMFCLTDSSIKYFPVKKLKHGDIPDYYPIWFVPSLL